MNTLFEFLKMLFWLTLAIVKMIGIVIAIVISLGILWIFLSILTGVRLWV